MPKYYFDICFMVNKDLYDVDNAERDLGFKPSRIDNANKSKNPNATISSLSITSKKLSDEASDVLFTLFLKSAEERLKKLNALMAKFEGSSIEAYLVILDHENLPTIGIEQEAIKLLQQYNISWYID